MVTRDWRGGTIGYLLVRCALCLALGGGVVLLTGCFATIGGSGDTPVETEDASGPEAETAAEADDGRQEDTPAGDGEATPETSDDQATEDAAEEPPLSEECSDRRACLTTFAVTELEAPDFARALSDLGYVWSERNQFWAKENGSASLVIHDEEGNLVTDAQLAELKGPMIEQPLVFRLVTSSYSTPKRVFNAAVSKSMVAEDAEFTDTSAVGVVTSPTQRRCLVFVSKTNDVHAITVVGEKAVSAGLFDREAQGEYGSTIDAVFEKLTGRTLEVEEPQQP